MVPLRGDIYIVQAKYDNETVYYLTFYQFNSSTRRFQPLEPTADESRLDQLAKQYGVAELIENHGELKASEIDALYRSLHLFVFPSLCESFGFPLVEAMAHGLPLLVAATDSNREVAGSAGLSFPPDDANTLADLIWKLAVEPAWHQDRAVASRERAACFSWDRAAAGTIELMENMLKDSIRRDTA